MNQNFALKTTFKDVKQPILGHFAGNTKEYGDKLAEYVFKDKERLSLGVYAQEPLSIYSI